MQTATGGVAEQERTAATSPVFFRHHVPEPPLSGFVGLLWYWRGHEVARSRERLLPAATVELVINLRSGRSSRSALAGPKSRPFLIERTEQDELLGVHFQPGGASPFLGFPLGELHNLNITLADLWGENKAQQLLSLLHEAPNVELKFRHLDRWLRQIARRPLGHHPAVSFAIRAFQADPSLHSVSGVAERTGFSERHFIRLFRDEVGMTPKLLSRVERFRKALRSIPQRDAVSWLDIALSCGYFDQAHFIHEFREFSGLTPSQYLGLRTQHLSHVQVPA